MSYGLIILTALEIILFVATLVTNPRKKISLWLDISVIAVLFVMLVIIIVRGS